MKQFLPQSLKRIVNKILYKLGYERRHCSHSHLEHLYLHDFDMMNRHMGCLHTENKNARLADLILHAHGLEKGLTMPDFRAGFGRDKVMHLCDSLIQYHAAGLNTEAFGFIFASRALKEYIAVHQKLGYDFPIQEQQKMTQAASLSTVTQTHQPTTTKAEYFQHCESNFEQFSSSRHSVRQFAGPAPLKAIEKAVALAQNAPSACNRQYSRVHLINGRENVNQILAMQGGNAALMNAAEQILILTADMQALMWDGERRDLWHTAGIYSMNLSYALHYYKIGHCMCAWSVGPDADRQLHQHANIPENEAIVVLMLIGEVPDSFKVASSPRRKVNETLIIHE